MTPIDILIRISKLNQKEFAAKVGIAEQTLSQMKIGNRDIPLSKFINWCKILEINPIEVFENYNKFSSSIK